MKRVHSALAFPLRAALLTPQPACFVADLISLELNKSGPVAELAVHSRMALPISGMYAEYRIQSNSNLFNWHPYGEPVAGGAGVRTNSLVLLCGRFISCPSPEPIGAEDPGAHP